MWIRPKFQDEKCESVELESYSHYGVNWGQHTMPWRWRRGRRFYFPTWQPVHFNKNVVVDWTYDFSAYPVRLIATAGNDLHLASYNDRSQERQINPDWPELPLHTFKTMARLPILHHHIHFYLFPTELVTVKWPSWKETQQDHCKTGSISKIWWAPKPFGFLVPQIDRFIPCVFEIPKLGQRPSNDCWFAWDSLEYWHFYMYLCII